MTLVDCLSAMADIKIGYFSAVIFMGVLFFLGYESLLPGHRLSEG